MKKLLLTLIVLFGFGCSYRNNALILCEREFGQNVVAAYYSEYLRHVEIDCYFKNSKKSLNVSKDLFYYADKIVTIDSKNNKVEKE